MFNGLSSDSPRLLFKGGTSLSKSFGLIDRFSEDIDITVFRDDLGQPATFLELERLSGKKRQRRLDAIKASCQACPSDAWPCKHVRALRATWETNPDSFLDVEAFLQGLDMCEKAELIEAIGKIVAAFPQTLGLFGLAGFDDTDDDDDDVGPAD